MSCTGSFDCNSEFGQLECQSKFDATLKTIIPTINTGILNTRIDCARAKFDSIAGNVFDEIQNQVTQILATSSTTTKDIFYISIGSIALVFILLTLIIFAAIYWRDTPNVILATFILALLVIIAVFIIDYFWLSSIYSSGSTSVDTRLTKIENILTNVEVGLRAGYCCFGGTNCNVGAPCTCCPP